MSEPGWHAYFRTDERLLWEGAPQPGVFGKAKIVMLGLFGLPFLAAGVATLLAGLRNVAVAQDLGGLGLGFFLTVFSLPFVGVGALMVVGQWIAAAQAHRKIRYALSTRAAYIAKNYWRRSLASYPILPTTEVELEKGAGADSVWFYSREERDSDGDRTVTRVGFENIADGDALFRLIRQIQTGDA